MDIKSVTMTAAKDIIRQLQLIPHPEGGYYREMYRSTDRIAEECLHHRFCGGSRSVSTAIYFMMETGNFSAFHRIKSDELWHHYEGVGLEIAVIHPKGTLEILKLGKNFAKGEQPLQVVPEGCWFASRVVEEGFALVGCTVAPGFDFTDFELADRSRLIKAFPEHEKIIVELTRLP